MKDGDSLNTILGYAKHVEGNQHSEHLSKVYLDTIKIPNPNVKMEAIAQKHNVNGNGPNKRSQSKGKHNNKGNCHNCGTSHALKSAQHMVKLAILIIRKDIISSVVDPGKKPEWYKMEVSFQPKTI